MLVASVTGVVLGLAVMTVGAWVTSSVMAASADTLDVAVEALAAADDGVLVAAEAVDAVAGVLDEAAATVFAAGVALDEAAPIIDDVAETLGTDVAGALDAAIQTLPSLVEVAGVVDSTLTAIGFVTFDPYDPPVPLEEAITELGTALEPIPDQLRDQADGIEAANASTREIAVGLQETAPELVEVRRSLEDASELLAGYRETTEEAILLAEDVRSDLAGLRLPAIVAVVLAGLVLVTTQLVPALVGLGLRGRGPLDGLGEE